ncbi:MAG: type II secretion system GspH family protein [Holosporales bacterium]|jgi:prepilin-type N-terminal cleavage/methylation domain-containing protein|nr:type II secretion system GspH family protein [Holosporales bacterium]
MRGRCNKRERGALSGFSLLEVAIALAVLGVLSNVLMGSTLMMQKHLQLRTTQEHMEMIVASLAAYVLRHAHLPAPEEASDSYVGKVPCAALGLPAHVGLDGWKQPIVYAVEEKLTTTRTLSGSEGSFVSDMQSSFCDVAQGTLRASSTPSSNASTVTAVVLYSSAGAPTTTAPFEGTTLNEDRAKSGIVRWVSRDVLMSGYAHAPCQQAGRPMAPSSAGSEPFF